MMQGKSGSAYLGVNALNPPDVTYKDYAPTNNDYIGYDLMHLWHVILPTTPTTYELWYLANKAAGYATWIRMYPQAGGGGGGNLRSDDTLISVPDPLGAINVWGGSPYAVGSDIRLGDPNYVNIYTVQYPDINTLEVVLKRSINQPLTNQTATEGMYSLGGTNFMHNFANTALGGDHNTWLGHNAGNLTMTTAAENVGIGYNALRDTATAAFCTAVGSNALANIDDGQYCIGIGYNAGINLDFADSDDIMIGNDGVLGDLNTIRIGKMPFPNPLVPVGPGEQDKIFLAGVWNCPAIPALNTGLVIVDDKGELYVDDIVPHAVICTDAGGNPVGKVGLDGEVLIGATGAAPEWKTLTAGPGIGIANGPNSITLTAGGVGAVVQLGADDGHTALPVGAQINIVGANLIETSVTPDLGQDLAVGITKGLADQVVGGNGVGVDPTWKTLACSDGSLDVIHTPAGIDITVIGVPPVGGVNYLMDHALLHVTPTLNGIQIEQGANITTVGDIALSKITVSVTDSVDLPLGHLSARDDVTTTAGDLVSSAGNLRLPQTNNLGTEGVVTFGGNRYIHQFGDTAGKKNIFVGYRSGNITMGPFPAMGVAIGNTGLGYATVEALTTGTYNTGAGYAALSDVTTGTYNTACGEGALQRVTTGSFNVGLGRRAGYNYTGDESSNICIEAVGVAGEKHKLRIGTHGTGDTQQSDCYIAGIRDAAAGTSPEMVVIGTIASGYKVWSQAIPGAGATTFHADDGNNAVPAAGILNVQGGYNIGTRAAANNIIIDVDDSIQQSITAVDGSTGVYAMTTRGANTYAANRFMHAWGGGLGMAGKNTSLGYQAGRINALAVGVNNTSVGYKALDAYTSASGCTAIGSGALGALVVSHNCVAVGLNAGSGITTAANVGQEGKNILIGTSAGATYTTSYNNIVIGDDSSSALGGAVEARTMRLGFAQTWAVPVPTPHNPDPVETLVGHGTDNTYIYGIYRNTVAYSGTPVYVDHLGKLGTDGGVMFAFRQTTSLGGVTGDGTVYVFGTSGGLTEDFDNTNSLTIGGAGAPAVFVAPYSGKYVFTASITYTIPAAPPPPTPPQSPLYVVTSNISYCFTTYIPLAIVGTAQQVSEIVTAIVYLDAGDTVRWACQVSGTTKTIGLLNYRAPTVPGVGVVTCYATYFTGYRIS